MVVLGVEVVSGEGWGCGWRAWGGAGGGEDGSGVVYLVAMPINPETRVGSFKLQLFDT